jgi:hypothetical protein
MQPHLVILNMDLDGQWVMQQIQASNVHGVGGGPDPDAVSR